MVLSGGNLGEFEAIAALSKGRAALPFQQIPFEQVVKAQSISDNSYVKATVGLSASVTGCQR